MAELRTQSSKSRVGSLAVERLDVACGVEKTLSSQTAALRDVAELGAHGIGPHDDPDGPPSSICTTIRPRTMDNTTLVSPDFPRVSCATGLTGAEKSKLDVES